MIIKINNFTYQPTVEGKRISYTYTELNEQGDIISSNNKRNFIVVDEELEAHIDAIVKYLEER